MTKRPVLLAALILGGFAFVGTTLVVVTERLTAARIEQNHREFLLKSLHEVLPRDELDNDLLADHYVTRIPELAGDRPLTVFRARKAGKPVAALFSPVIAKGYSGPIELLVGVYADGRLAGARVLSHMETPGLGDRIDTSKSDWILGFRGRSLGNPPEKQWKVKRDGGVFDQFTGATITPRGIVKALKTTLEYFRDHRDALFAHPADEDHKTENHRD